MLCLTRSIGVSICRDRGMTFGDHMCERVSVMQDRPRAIYF